MAKASVLQAEYRGFESHTPNWSLPYGLDFKKVFNVEPEINVVYTPLVINGNITVSKTEDGGSNPSRCAKHKISIMAITTDSKLVDVGSIPTSCANCSRSSGVKNTCLTSKGSLVRIQPRVQVMFL